MKLLRLYLYNVVIWVYTPVLYEIFFDFVHLLIFFEFGKSLISKKI